MTEINVEIIERPFNVYVSEENPMMVTVALPASFQNYIINMDGGKNIFVRAEEPPEDDSQDGDIWFRIV